MLVAEDGPRTRRIKVRITSNTRDRPNDGVMLFDG